MNAVARFETIDVRPLSGALGAEIFGVDLASGLSDAAIRDVHAAWLEHQVVFFRDQRISPSQQVAFARHFGELDTYPFIKPLPGHPAVITIIKEPDTKYNFGGGWHSYTSYQSILRANC